MIQSRNFAYAEQRLNSINNRNAEWHYLYGVIMYNKNWYDSALDHINTAVRMDPNNFEYRQTLNSLRQRGNNFSNPYYRTTGMNNNYFNIVDAFKEALSEMKIELDDEVAGRFVENTITNAIYN